MKYYNIGNKALKRIAVGKTEHMKPSAVGQRRWKKVVCIKVCRMCLYCTNWAQIIQGANSKWKLVHS